MITITPAKASYQIGETVSAASDGGPFFFSPGNTVHLHIVLDDGVTYGDPIASGVAAGGEGAVNFGSFVIPARVTGANRQWVAVETATMVEDFGEVFTLLPAPARARNHGLRLGLSIGLLR